MAGKPLPQSDIDAAVKAHKEHGGSRRKAAAALGISPQQMQRRLEAAQAGRPEQVAATPAITAASVRQADEITYLRNELKATIRHNLDAETVREEILGLTGHPIKPPVWMIDPTLTDTGPGVPAVMWSDWHWGEVVNPVEVGGVNAFDLDIGKKRVKRMIDLIVNLAFKHQVHQGYPGIVVMLGGDMVTGEIHQELAETNAARMAPVLADLVGVLIWAIDRLLEAFPCIFIPCVVGNHGRMTLKPRAKNRAHTSFEWLVYVMLERHYLGNDRVKFLVSNDSDAHFTIAGLRYILTHGDAIGAKGGDGHIGAIGPIMRGTMKTLRSESQVNRNHDIMCIGHWHNYMPLHESGVIVNGTLKGYDEYAKNILRVPYQRPIQAMWYTHPVVGVTKHEPLYLEKRRDAVKNAPMVTFPHVVAQSGGMSDE